MYARVITHQIFGFDFIFISNEPLELCDHVFVCSWGLKPCGAKKTNNNNRISVHKTYKLFAPRNWSMWWHGIMLLCKSSIKLTIENIPKIRASSWISFMWQNHIVFSVFMFPRDVCDGLCGVLCPSEERQFKSLHCLLFFGWIYYKGSGCTSLTTYNCVPQN